MAVQTVFVSTSAETISELCVAEMLRSLTSFIQPSNSLPRSTRPNGPAYDTNAELISTSPTNLQFQPTLARCMHIAFYHWLSIGPVANTICQLFHYFSCKEVNKLTSVVCHHFFTLPKQFLFDLAYMFMLQD